MNRPPRHGRDGLFGAFRIVSLGDTAQESAVGMPDKARGIQDVKRPDLSIAGLGRPRSENENVLVVSLATGVTQRGDIELVLLAGKPARESESIAQIGRQKPAAGDLLTDLPGGSGKSGLDQAVFDRLLADLLVGREESLQNELSHLVKPRESEVPRERQGVIHIGPVHVTVRRVFCNRG